MSLTRQQWTLIAIAGLFFAPVITAMLMQSDWWDYRPASMKNAGILLQPPLAPRAPVVDGENPAVAGDWALLYPVSGSCDSTCERDVTNLRQVHIATGRHVDSLQVVLLRSGPFTAELASRLHAIYTPLMLRSTAGTPLQDDLGRARDQAAGHAGLDDAVGAAGWTFLADPAGNIILAYPPPQRPNDIKKDLKRLLTYASGESHT